LSIYHYSCPVAELQATTNVTNRVNLKDGKNSSSGPSEGCPKTVFTHYSSRKPYTDAEQVQQSSNYTVSAESEAQGLVSAG